MISVIIPVYKNWAEFIKNLEHNLTFLNNCEIIIINDDPSSRIKNDLSKFKYLILIENKKNLGFGESVNKAMQIVKNKYVMLLNSDVLLQDENYKLTLDYFAKNALLFAVCFAQKEKDGFNVGKNRIYWKNGFIRHEKSNSLTYGNNAWAEGGACIIDREKFVQLGAYDPIYSPFYWEDIDLSYRAWKRGYQIIFDPQIQVQHFHESTISRYFSKGEIKKIAYRNQFIFIWKNIFDGNLISEHVINLIPTLIKLILKGEFSSLKGFIDALTKVKLIIKKRAQEKKVSIKSDQNVLNSFK